MTELPWCAVRVVKVEIAAFCTVVVEMVVDCKLKVVSSINDTVVVSNKCKEQLLHHPILLYGLQLIK